MWIKWVENKFSTHVVQTYAIKTHAYKYLHANKHYPAVQGTTTELTIQHTPVSGTHRIKSITK